MPISIEFAETKAGQETLRTAEVIVAAERTGEVLKRLFVGAATVVPFGSKAHEILPVTIEVDRTQLERAKAAVAAAGLVIES